MKLKVVNIEKSFGDKKVLNNISFEAQSGRAVGILGRNGAGKTTTIRIIMGVFNGDDGEIFIDDKPINQNKVSIGYLPEERGLYPKKIIMEQLLYFGALKGMNKKSAIKQAEYWLQRLEMTEYKNKRLDTLSKGNQQKIQLAATLINEPDIVILDEPFSGLDPVNAMLLKDIVKEIIAKDKIVLFSSHQMNYIEEFCDDIVVLNDGEIVLSGSIKQIKRSYDRRKIVVLSQEAEKICSSLNAHCTMHNDRVMVTLDSENDKSALLKQLAEIGADIDEIKVFEPSLNDIFVEYTGNSEQ